MNAFKYFRINSKYLNKIKFSRNYCACTTPAAKREFRHQHLRYLTIENCTSEDLTQEGIFIENIKKVSYIEPAHYIGNKLDVSERCLKPLPNMYLPNLCLFEFRYNDIPTLPKLVFSALERCFICENKLETIEELYIPETYSLQISDNNTLQCIKKLYAPSITSLYLRGNRLLQEMPEFAAPNVSHIDIINTGIAELDLAQFPSLEFMYFSTTKLINVPSELTVEDCRNGYKKICKL